MHRYLSFCIVITCDSYVQSNPNDIFILYMHDLGISTFPNVMDCICGSLLRNALKN